MVACAAPPGPEAAPVKAPEAKPAAAKPGGVIRMRRLEQDPTHDLQIETGREVALLWSLASHRLLTYKILQPPLYRPGEIPLVADGLDVTPHPDLAERWEISPDGKSFTFFLRKGVKWHNVPPVNGREVTAEDVVFSFDRLRLGGAPYYNQDPRFQLQDRFREVSKVEALDKYTVKFTFSQPSVAFEHWMGSPASTTAEGLLATLAGSMTAHGSNPVVHAGSQPTLILGPEHAHLLAREGMTKAQVKAALWERTTLPLADLSPELAQKRVLQNREVQGGKVHVLVRPEDLILVVAGGAGAHSVFMNTFNSVPVTRKIGD